MKAHHLLETGRQFRCLESYLHRLRRSKVMRDTMLDSRIGLLSSNIPTKLSKAIPKQIIKTPKPKPLLKCTDSKSYSTTNVK